MTTNTWPPYCGVEMLPHAVDRDGHAAPIICTQDVHDESSMHLSDEPEVWWPWQRQEKEA